MNIENYTDGKERSFTDKVREFERIFGIAALSPFGTNNKEVFEEKLASMPLKEMTRLAEKLGIIKAADIEVQKTVLRESFTDWVRKNGDPVGDKVKGKRPLVTPQRAYDNINRKLDRDHGLDTFAKVFPEVNSEEALVSILKNYTLTELRHVAARLGFNPSFDKQRLILLLKKEFTLDLKGRVEV